MAAERTTRCARQAAHASARPQKKTHLANGQARRDVAACPSRRSAFHLNSTICAAAEIGAEALLQLVDSKLKEMNIVNISTALHRLARLETEAKGESSNSAVCGKDKDPRLEALMAAAKSKISSSTGQAKARCLSSIAWSSARLRTHEPEMMHTIGNLALAQIPEFKPFELVILLWSFRRMELQHAELFSKASAHILTCMDQYTAPCLATAVWSFAKCPNSSYADFCREAANAFADRIESREGIADVTPVALENIMWGLASIQVHPTMEALRTITRAALMFLEQFKVHEFTIILWSFARLGACDCELFTVAAKVLEASRTLKENMHSQGMANLLWAFARYSEKGDAVTFNKVVRLLLPTCQKLLPEFKPQELSIVLGALSKLERQSGADSQVDHIFIWAAWRSHNSDFESFFSDLSIQSIVAILTACVRFMGSQNDTQEPYDTFISKLLCLCPRFFDQLDEVVALSILEIGSALQHWAPQVEHTMEIVANVAGQRIALYGPSALARLAAAIVNLPSDIGDLLTCLVARRLLCVNLKVLSASECMGIARMCGLEAGSSSPRSLHAVLHDLVGKLDQDSTADDCPAAWQASGTAELVEATPKATRKADTSGCYATRRRVSFCNEVQTYEVEVPEKPSCQDEICSIDADPMYLYPILDMPASLPTHLSSEPATLVVLDDFSGTSGEFNSEVAITFEVNSPKPSEVYQVRIDTYYNGDLDDTFEMDLEAGDSIPNTQSLTLSCMPHGRHEVHFTLNNERSEAQGETTVYRLQSVHGTVLDGNLPGLAEHSESCTKEYFEELIRASACRLAQEFDEIILAKACAKLSSSFSTEVATQEIKGGYCSFLPEVPQQECM